MKPATDVTTEEAKGLIDQGKTLIASTMECSTQKKLAALMQEDGSLYFGEWKEGTKHGKGEQRWPDNRVYIGDWVNDKAEGQGKITHADGE